VSRLKTPLSGVDLYFTYDQAWRREGAWWPSWSSKPLVDAQRRRRVRFPYASATSLTRVVLSVADIRNLERIRRSCCNGVVGRVAEGGT
jgi:hypothetical protein